MAVHASFPFGRSDFATMVCCCSKFYNGKGRDLRHEKTIRATSSRLFQQALLAHAAAVEWLPEAIIVQRNQQLRVLLECADNQLKPTSGSCWMSQ